MNELLLLMNTLCVTLSILTQVLQMGNFLGLALFFGLGAIAVLFGVTVVIYGIGLLIIGDNPKAKDVFFTILKAIFIFVTVLIIIAAGSCAIM